MVSIQIKIMLMMDQVGMDYVRSSIYLSNYNDDEKKIKIMVSIQIKMMAAMDQDDKTYVGN